MDLDQIITHLNLHAKRDLILNMLGMFSVGAMTGICVFVLIYWHPDPVLPPYAFENEGEGISLEFFGPGPDYSSPTWTSFPEPPEHVGTLCTVNSAWSEETWDHPIFIALWEGKDGECDFSEFMNGIVAP
jgi:hypothetical protein